MAEIFAKVGKEAFHACVGSGGRFLFNIAADNVEVARELGDVAVKVTKELGSTAVKLASIYAGYRLLSSVIDGAFKNAFGGQRDDQEIGEPRISSLHVPVRCFTDERFLDVLAHYESGEIKRRLENELEQGGLKVEGLTVEIENMDEVNERKRAIEER